MNLPAGHIRRKTAAPETHDTQGAHTMSGCGTGSCGCSSAESSQASAPIGALTPTQAAAYEAVAASMVDAPVQSAPSSAPFRGCPCGVNSIIDKGQRVAGRETLASAPALNCCARRRSRPACCLPTILQGVEGATSAEASNAIEQLLDRGAERPEPFARGLAGTTRLIPPPARGANAPICATCSFAVTPG